MSKKTDNRAKEGIFYEVWGDLVDLKELLIASVIGVVLSMGAYLIAKTLFLQNPALSESVATGYALFAGIGGCIASCVVCAFLFKPKRTIYEESGSVDLMQVLQEENVDIEAEIRELKEAPADVIREMEENGLDLFLKLREQELPREEEK